MVDIPVLALRDASMLYGFTLGQHIGIVTIIRRYLPWFEHQIRKYDLEFRIDCVHAMTFEPGQILRVYDLIRLPGYCSKLNPDELRTQNVKASGLGKSRPSNRTELRASVRGHLHRRHRQPQAIRNLFQQKHVRYAA